MAKNEQRSALHISSPHARENEELLQELDTNAEEGLSRQEAEQRLQAYGPNQLEEQEQQSLLALLLSQLNNPVIYLLVAACGLAFAFGDTPEAIAIIVVIVLNTAIGFWMEFQARQSMKALKKMDVVKARVLRDGREQEINAEQLVPGDILLLETGALVPADGRILSESELSIDESPLTGESVPVEKDAAPLKEDTQVADRRNMVFKGTAITNGSGKVAVAATGMRTEIGNISALVSSAEAKQAPLDKKLQRLSHRLIWVTLGLAALFFLFGWMAGKPVYQLVQTAIAWTIAAIPEGLPIVASIALARGMLRLAKRNVIVKRLSAVETLGETTVIFTDKTGTLTENRLTLDTIQLDGVRARVDWKDDGASVRPTNEGASAQSGERKDLPALFFRIATLCNDASLSEENNGQREGKGDPLDLALLRFCQAYDKVMRQKPKEPKEPIVTRRHWLRIGTYGLILTSALAAAYFFAREYWGLGPEACNNIAFFSLAFAQLWHVFNMREAEEPLFDNQVTRNKYIWGALALCTAAVFAAYFVPALKAALSFQTLSGRAWGLIAVTSVVPVLVIQAGKVVAKGYSFWRA
ncbi:MAG: cation-translocating P-type ATPase [Phaeodactylibacter sp.]|nr:cation-translocating P-type ATPase [Phaeodactylibacter sp.]